MATDLRLESYLHALDRALGQMPISQRAEIVIEIKNQILERQDKDPSVSIDQVLASVGQPEVVAGRYLSARGLTSTPPARTSVVKWLVIGFLGTIGIFALFVTILIFKFSPLIEISEKDGHFKIFGGTIETDWNGMGNFSNQKGGFNASYHTIAGAREIDPSAIDRVSIPFSLGKFEIFYGAQKTFSWDCKSSENSDAFAMATEEKRILTLNLTKAKGIKCELTLPQGVPVALLGDNGDLQIENPQGPLDVQLENGRVMIIPDDKRTYNYDLKVFHGKTDSFDSINSADAIKIKVEIKNGYVKKG